MKLNIESGLVVDHIATVRKLTTSLPFNYEMSGIEMNIREEEFLKSLSGRWPTFEEVQDFSKANNGIKCRMYAYAACSLFAERGIQSQFAVLTGRNQQRKKAHALVLLADQYWFEPQNGDTVSTTSIAHWDILTQHYGKLFGIEPGTINIQCEIPSKPRTYQKFTPVR